MRPKSPAGLVVVGLAAAGAAWLLFASGPPADRVVISFDDETPRWIVAQNIRPGADAVRLHIRQSGLRRNDRLVLKMRNGDGRQWRRTLVIHHVGDPARVVWDGMDEDRTPLAPGSHEMQIEVRRDAGMPARTEWRPLTVVNVDLDVDADRDGLVTDRDEQGEDAVTADRGAYFAVNIDADGQRRNGDGRPISDSVVFDDITGQPILLDNRIENEADRNGLAPLVIRGFGGPLPTGMRVFLRVAEGEDIESVQIYARREPGARAIWGGLGTREGRNPIPTEIDITRFVDPASPDYAATGTSDDLTFAVEGLFFRNDPVELRKSVYPYPLIINPFDGDIDLFLEIRHTDEPHTVLYSDHVRMRVVPWLMVPHTNRSLTVFARDVAEENAATINGAETGYSSLSESGQLVLIGSGQEDDEEDDFRWLQDHAVLGAFHLPGTGADGRTYAALRLPYEVEENVAQPEWVAEHLTGPDRGVFQFGSWLGSDHGAPDRAGGGHGGNIDVIPPSASWPLGRIVVGDTMPGGLRVFLASQRVQPLVTLPTRWLAVGHIDEMIGFTGQGGETLIADPVHAFRLLESIPENRRGASVFFAGGGAPLAGKVRKSAPKISEKERARRLDTGIDHRGSNMRYVRIYRDGGSGAAGQVARIAKDGLRDGYVLIDHVWETATRVLPRMIGEPSVLDLIGIADDSENAEGTEPVQDSEWLRIPGPGDKFVMVADTRFWIGGVPAMISVEEVLADTRLRRLNTQHVAARLAVVRGLLQREGGRKDDGTPFLTFRSVPVIYVGRPGTAFMHGRSAAGLTPNLANFQLIGDDLYMPRQFGPLGSDGRDIFESAVRETLGQRVRFVDTWDAYHRQYGEVHCATNVLRSHFDFDWWTRMVLQPS